jgi:hypothetical protein
LERRGAATTRRLELARKALPSICCCCTERRAQRWGVKDRENKNRNKVYSDLKDGLMDSVTRLALPAAKKKVGADDELPGHLCYLLQKKKHCFFIPCFIGTYTLHSLI